LAIQWDRQKNENKNLKFKITCSDSWFTRDKAHHFLTSAFLSATGYYLLREEQNFSNQQSQIGGFCISFSLGLAKEIRDGLKQNNAASAKDFVANLLGIAVGIMIISD
jgi:putative lipoprotein